MAYTLSDFINSGITSDILQLTHRTDLSSIAIRRASVQELPVGAFIQKNELVLSTAAGCTDDPDAFKELIKWASDSEAAALLVCFEDVHYKVADNVIEFADSERLPLFRIPWSDTFSEIIAKVSTEVAIEELSAYQDLQSKLFNAFFESKSLQDSIVIISAALNCSTAVLNSEGKAIAADGIFTNPKDISDCRDKLIDPGSDKKSHADENETVLSLDISINDAVCGAILMHFSDPGLSAVFRALSIDQQKKYICFPLSLWFNKKNIESIVEGRLKNDFVWDLATENYDSPAEMVKEGALLGFDLNRPYTCVMMRAVPKNMDNYLEGYSAVNAANVNKDIEDVLIGENKSWGGDTMVSGRGLNYIMYLCNYSKKAPSLLDAHLDGIRERLIKSFPAYDFFCGISDISFDTPDYSRLYQDASLALQYCLNMGNVIYRFTYRDAREMEIVKALSADESIKKLSEGLITSLTDSGEFGRELIATLTSYIKNNYNVSRTARELNIHRQTLLYRLDKIEALTGMSLSSHQDLFLMEIAVRILSYY